MKNIKKIIVLMLVFAVCATMLASCGNVNNKVVATVDGKGYVYEDDEDFSDFYHLYTYYYKVEYTESGKDVSIDNLILREAVNSTLELRMLEDEAERRGYSVDMAKVEAGANEDKQVLEEYYTGGFDAFCTQWNMSQNVFITLNTYEELQELAKEKFFTTKKVKDEEALAYYEKNINDFIKKPHYEVKELFLQITDNTNKVTVYKDALIYIGILNAGRGWDFVLNTSQKKYNLENGMIFSHYLTGEEIINESEVVKNGSRDDQIQAAADSFNEKHGYYYEDMFPEGFEEYVVENEIAEGSEQYRRLFEIHMTYCSEIYKIERDYAISEKWKTGKSYSIPIYHGGFQSYIVLYFADVEDEEGEVSFEDAKDEIIELMMEDRKERTYGYFMSRKMAEIDVQIKYAN